MRRCSSLNRAARWLEAALRSRARLGRRGGARKERVNRIDSLEKNRADPLKLFPVFQIFLASPSAAGVPIGLRKLRRAPDGVRSLLGPILLQGGFGYEV